MTWWTYSGNRPQPFKPAPRAWRGNMCGIRLAGAPPVSGGADDASLILSWFIDRYLDDWQARIRAAWKARGDADVLLSWPDSRAAGHSPEQFAATCRRLIAGDFYPCPMLYSKDFDPSDFAGIMANIAPVLPHIIGLVPRVCIGWEMSIALSPTTVQELIDTIAPQFTPAGTKVYVHFAQGVASWQQDGNPFAAFWNANVGKLTGLLHQRKQSADGNGPAWDRTETRYRYSDILDRFAGNFGCSPDSGFGHPFDCIGLELTAMDQFNGQMSEAEGDDWGRWVIGTPASHGPAGWVSIQGSGNGF